MRSSGRGQVVSFQALESRRLFAAIMPSILSTSAGALGNVLTITGSAGNDQISITNTSAGLRISNATGWSTLYSGALALIKVLAGAGDDRITIDANIRTSTMLFGGAGIDTLAGGTGADSLYGGDGRDYLYGQAGDDTLVSIGDGSIDRLYGGAGFDGFWCDNNASGELVLDSTSDETTAGAVHRVGSFLSGTFGSVTLNAPLALNGQNLADPTITGESSGYRNFSNKPLFSKYGPTADDIYQGSIGDCYLLASLGAIAKANAQLIRQSVVELGDGTYAVQFTNGSTKTFVRVDGDLPIDDYGLAYAKQGRQGSIWTALVEKAYAFFRYNQGSYASLDGGFMNDVYGHMGLSNASALFTASNAQSLLQQLKADLDAGKAVTFGTKLEVGDAPLTAGHAYMVDAVITDSSGQFTALRLRNPWGYDDAPGHGANDGYITLTAQQAMSAFWFACMVRAR